jgi:hypothetical protein
MAEVGSSWALRGGQRTQKRMKAAEDAEIAEKKPLFL